MNKPLTIDELKSLEVGDWVWVKAFDNYYYYKILVPSVDETVFSYRHYLVYCETSLLDEWERYYIKQWADEGYQLRNIESGGTTGKTDINERKPSRGYRDGVKQMGVAIFKSYGSLLCQPCGSFDSCEKNGKPDCGLCDGLAKDLINAGYGNVKQAVKEFAEKLKSNSKRFGNIDGDNYYVWFESELDKLFNELYGADE